MNAEQLSTFSAAISAFLDLLRKDLSKRWRNCEVEAHCAILGSSLLEKNKAFSIFLGNVKVSVAEAIREYFPRLLLVATTHGQHLGGQSPLAWTRDRMVTAVCEFLQMDERLCEGLEPSDQSRIAKSAERIAKVDGGQRDMDTSDFLLPRWVGIDPLNHLRMFSSPEARAAFYVEHDGEYMSREETVDWIRGMEFAIGLEIEKCLREESLNALLDAGGTGVSVLLTGRRPKLRSPLKIAVNEYLNTSPDAPDKKILERLRNEHPDLCLPEWDENEKLAFDTFTKVRKYRAEDRRIGSSRQPPKTAKKRHRP